VDRLACVNIIAFPLQLLLRDHPDWIDCPAAVVAEEKPQGTILYVNKKAREAGIVPGLRYAAGAALAATLRAGAVSAVEIEKEVKSLAERLLQFTPEVEPSADEPGIFWLGATGLDRLYPALDPWVSAISAALKETGFYSTVVAGFTRFGAYALAKARRRSMVIAAPSIERDLARRVPLSRLDLEPRFRDTLLKLGVKTVGAMLALPASGIRERFGPEAHRLHRMASGELWAPLQPHQPCEPVSKKFIFDNAEDDVTRLLFLAKTMLHSLLERLAGRQQALTEISLRLQLERSGWREDIIRPAAPTLDITQLMDLIRLRLEGIELAAGICEIELTVYGTLAAKEQLRLFAGHAGRDLAAANRALARLRAEFGEESVVRLRLLNEHLPEASFTWEPAAEVVLAKPREVDQKQLVQRQLVRRVFTDQIALKPQKNGPRLPQAEGQVLRLIGPYTFSGAWWGEVDEHRDYYFAETVQGSFLWIYLDLKQHRWFLQGRVE
jgi:protein ImuB